MKSLMDETNDSTLVPAQLVRSVIVSPWVWDGMVYASEQDSLETGGILMGTTCSNRSLLIGLATGPGPNAERTRASFERDIPAVRGAFDAMSTLYPLGFVGIWHTHPGSPVHSNRDLETWRDLVTNLSWNLAAAVCPILGRDSSGKVDSLQMYYIQRGWLDPIVLPWRIAHPTDPVLSLAYRGKEEPWFTRDRVGARGVAAGRVRRLRRSRSEG